MAPDPRMIRAQRYPLHSAVTAGDLTRTRGLLDSQTRCQINRKYETSGQTPLHLAASTGCPAMLQMLIDAGAHIDAYDSVKQTPLHYSMTNTRWGVMETLVKAGADVNTRRMKDGWTPLFLACIFGYTYKAKYLVDSSADVLLADDLGWTPEDWVDKYGMPAVSKILKGAPRVVTESSARKYVEIEKEDKLEVPVEFDEGISKLLAKIELKRKAKIEEHKKLFLKLEKEKEEEEKRNKAKEKEKLMLEELDLKAQEENERKLNEATANIIGRQNRLQKEKEAQKHVQDESTNIKLDPTKKDKTDPDVNLIKDSKMLKKEVSNDCQFSALLSEVVVKPNMHNNQAEEVICFEKEPILAKRIKRENQKQEKTSADVVLNKDYFTIEQSESVSIINDTTCNDMEILEKKNEKEDFNIHCTYKLQGDEQDNLINQEGTQILQKPLGLTKSLKTEKESNVEFCVKKKRVNVSINEKGEHNDKLKSELLVAISVEADTDCTRKDGILKVCPEQETSLESTAVTVDTFNHSPTTAIDAVFDPKELSGCKSKTKCKRSEMLPIDSVNLLPGKLSNKLEVDIKGTTISGKEPNRENNVLTDCCNADVFESESNTKSEETTLVPDTDKKELDDNKKTRKLIWEVHSDTFIKNSQKIVKKKDSQLDKSNPSSNNTQIFDQTRKPDTLDKVLPRTLAKPAIGTSNKQKNKTTKETHPPSQDKKCQAKHKQLVDNPLDLTSQEKKDVPKFDCRSEDNLQEITEKDKPIKESLGNALHDGKQLADHPSDLVCSDPAHSKSKKEKEILTNDIRFQTNLKDKIEEDIKIKEFSNESLLDEKHLSDIPSKLVCKDTSGFKSKEEKDMGKDDCREQNNLPQASEMEKKENPILSPIDDPTTDAQKQTDGSSDLKSSDLPCTIVEVRNEAVKSEIKNESCLPKTKRVDSLGVNLITEISSHKENDGSIQGAGSDLTSQRKVVKLLEKSHLTTDGANMEYIKVSDGDYPCKEQKPSNTVLSEIDCSINEKSEKHPKVEEKQIISTDYPEKNVEVVRKEFSEVTSAESKLPKTSPETCTKHKTNINYQNHQEIAPSTDLSENMNTYPYSKPNTANKIDKDMPQIQNHKLLSNVQSDITEQRYIKSEQAKLDMDDLIQNSDLPELIEDPEFGNRLKVFNNYRNFGAMYSAKKNFKKAEWAFKNGIKQTVGQPARSKEQLRSILATEIEFRLDRARSLVAMGMDGDAREECQAVLKIDYHNHHAVHIIEQC